MIRVRWTPVLIFLYKTGLEVSLALSFPEWREWLTCVDALLAGKITATTTTSMVAATFWRMRSSQDPVEEATCTSTRRKCGSCRTAPEPKVSLPPPSATTLCARISHTSSLPHLLSAHLATPKGCALHAVKKKTLTVLHNHDS